MPSKMHVHTINHVTRHLFQQQKGKATTKIELSRRCQEKNKKDGDTDRIRTCEHIMYLISSQTP